MDNERLEYLLSQHFNQMLEPDELKELEQMLLESRTARGEFWKMAKVHAALWQWGQEGWGRSEFSVKAAGLEAAARRKRAERSFFGRAGWAMAAAAVLALGFIVWAVLPAKAAPRPGVAMMGASSEAVWMAGNVAPRKGVTLTDGWLRLESGSAQIEFFSGARVLLEGPAEFRLVTKNEGELRYGKFSAVVPEPARGFTVRTESLTIVDYGTEFGCVVPAGGLPEVHVFDGEVGVRTVEAQSEEVALTTNEAVRVEDAALVPIEVNAGGFLGEREFIRMTHEGATAQYRGWQQFRKYFKQRPDLLVYLDFEKQADRLRSLPNLAQHAGGSEAAIVGSKFVEGRWAQKTALEFKNPNDRVRVTVPGEYDSLTLFAWVQINATPNRLNSLLMAENQEALGELHWYVYWKGTLGAAVRNAPRGSRHQWWHAQSGTALGEDTVEGWIFLASVIDRQAGELRHYVNGELDGAVPFSFEQPLRLGTLEIGNWGLPAGAASEHYNLDGRIDELAIVSSVLNDNELQSIYEVGRPTLP